MSAVVTSPISRTYAVEGVGRSYAVTGAGRSYDVAGLGRSYDFTGIRRTYAVFRPSPTEVPEGVLLDDDGVPLRDDDGNFLIED
ncbi:MAG: hypothetical protein ACK4NR_09135 [Micavibrio sp.]